MRKEPRCSEFRNISILGLGKLGTVAAGCYASRGFRVIGADTDQNVVDSCNSGRPPVQEPVIGDLYRAGNWDRPAAPNCDTSRQKLPDRVKSASGKILGGRVRTRFEYNELEE